MREEHASWITDGVALDALLRDALTSAPLTESPGLSLRELQRQLVLANDGEFVALADSGERPQRLFNGQHIVEQLAREAAKRVA